MRGARAGWDGAGVLAGLGAAGVMFLVAVVAFHRAPPQVASPRWDTEEIPSFVSGIAMRAMDRDVLRELQSGHVARSATRDLYPDRPYRVRLAGSPATQDFRWVLVDLDRDGRWDERWDLGDPGRVVRDVERDPGAEGREVSYTLIHGRWQPR